MGAVFHVELRPRHGPGQVLPEKKDVLTRMHELGYFGVELLATEPCLAFTIRCGTETRALELARDIQHLVLGDSDWSRYEVTVAPVGSPR